MTNSLHWICKSQPLYLLLEKVSISLSFPINSSQVLKDMCNEKQQRHHSAYKWKIDNALTVGDRHSNMVELTTSAIT